MNCAIVAIVEQRQTTDKEVVRYIHERLSDERNPVNALPSLANHNAGLKLNARGHLPHGGPKEVAGFAGAWEALVAP